MAIRTLIVEDEPLARRTLRDFLSGEADFELVGEADNGLHALALIDSLEPDLVFLDLHMPELGGMDVLRQSRAHPAIVFTTAYERYAVQAFEFEAIDYLLKPFTRERFGRSLERVRRRLILSATVPRDPAPEPRLSPSHTFFVRHLRALVPIRLAAVLWFGAEDDYVALHLGERKYLVHMRLRDLVQRLDPEAFVQVSRSAIVALAHVVRAEREGRCMVLVLANGERLLSSRRHSPALAQRLRTK